MLLMMLVSGLVRLHSSISSCLVGSMKRFSMMFMICSMLSGSVLMRSNLDVRSYLFFYLGGRFVSLMLMFLEFV